MRLHRCAQVGCTNLIKLGHDYCEAHYTQRMDQYNKAKQEREALSARTLRGQHDKAELARKYNAEVRPELGHEFYQDKRWEQLSAHIKMQKAYTDEVTGRVHDKGEVIVDHIIPRRLSSPEQLYDPDNLMVLSRSTHNTKTSLERSMTDAQLKHVGREWWLKVLRGRGRN